MSGKEKIAETLGGRAGWVFYDEPMSRHTSMKVGGKADALVSIENEDQLAEIVARLKAAKINYLPVGNLTNIIVRDGGYRGVILLLNGFQEIICRQAPQGGYFIAAQAGAPLSSVVGIAAEHELTGLEFCAGIPGSIGGAVWMNAGAFGKEMKDVLFDVSLLDYAGRRKTLKREEIEFHYRHTVLPPEAIILTARLQLEKGESKKIQEKIREIMRLRREKHPLVYPSAGSVFKNLPGMPAGRIIEEMGLKGKRCGDAEVSLQHANFIVNRGKATASDVLNLISIIQNRAKKEKGVTLDTEVIIVGEN